VVARSFDSANAASVDTDILLSRVVFPPPVFDAALRERQESTLAQSEYAQSAIGALSAGQFSYLAELGLTCSAYGGHSFGELTALWAAGALSEADFFRLAGARGRAMALAPDHDAGAMAALTATRDRVAELLTGFSDVAICQHNTPEQVVVGGAADSVARLVRQCGELNIEARLLPDAGAFHTQRVAHAVDAFRAAVDAVAIGEPNAPVHANSPGASYGVDPAANGHTLLQQLLEPVEFVDVLTSMRAAGTTVFVEFGPEQVLTQFVRRTLGDDVRAIATGAGPGDDSDIALKRAAVQLAVLGMPLSGINRHTEPPVKAAEPAGMSVTLSASEYVPEKRRAAYRAALNDGPRALVEPETRFTAARSGGPGSAAPAPRPPAPQRPFALGAGGVGLKARHAAPSAPAPAFTARRDVEAIAGDPVMQAHRIGANAVLPATFGVGWLVNVVESAYPDMYVVEATDFQVFKGIVFNGTPQRGCTAQVNAGTQLGDRILVRATVHGETDAGRPIPHYAATFTLADAPAPQPVLDVPPVFDGPEDTAEIYLAATLFHGPALQGIRKVLDRSPGRVVLQCKLPDTDIGDRTYHGTLHSPVLADLLLQGTAVLAMDVFGEAPMPLGIGRAEWFAPLPDDEPFILVLDDARRGPATITITATAVATDGHVLQRFSDILLVSTKGVRIN
jgi:malonyl CoA-acyl carrier protein transacylase